MPNTSRLSIDQNRYTKVSTSLGAILVQSYRGAVLVAVSDVEPDRDTEARHLWDSREPLVLEAPDADVWVRGTTHDQFVAVTEASKLYELTDRGSTGWAVFIQDQTTGILDVPFLRELSSPTLGADTVVNSRDIQLAPGHGLTIANIGDIMELADSSNGSWFIQAAITNVTGDIIELDSPVNRIYTVAGSLVAHSTADMNVDGSITPQIFRILPFPVQEGDMVRTIVEMRADSAMAFDTFGSLPELANGLVMRINNGDGTYRHLYNFKSNGDIIEQAFDHSFQTGVGGATRGFTSRITWGGQSKRGVVIRLDGGLNESLEIIIQDDLTGLQRMHWTCNGSELQE